MNAVKNSSVETMEGVVQALIGGGALNQCSICLNCRGLVMIHLHDFFFFGCFILQ